ncbi:MAG: glycosyltransferase family 2 protein [Anaerolineaceae bacterium]|jgi:cellulose synthase/poly-beta-1,6-N-acetylglucosamine synthase-like glycosyltransferase|nr:MAG: glycosyltransferase family 2 protein [Anaerolineaceae bacterium]
MSASLAGNFVISLLFWLCVGGILYAYAGYPVLVFLLAKMKPAPPAYGEYHPCVTLLIAAYNEEREIEEKIQNCLALDYPASSLQILIVTDGSTDRTPEIVQSYATSRIELLHQTGRRGKTAAINRAMPSVRGEIVVFSDANNHYLPDTISKLVAPFRDPKIGAASGAKVIEKGDGSLGASEGAYWKYESFIKKQESRLGSCTSAAGEILAIRKDLYISPPDHIINDDFFIAMQIIRQGYRLIYVPEAKSMERVSPTAQDEIVRRTRINAGRYQAIAMTSRLLPLNSPLLIWQVISHKFLRLFVPFFMIGAAAFNLIAVIYPPHTKSLALLGPPFGIILFGLQALFYALAIMGGQFPHQGERNRFLNLLYLPAFLTNSNLAALKGFSRFLRGGQAHLWERIQRR